MRILRLDHESDAREELARVGADPAAWPVFLAKRAALSIRLVDLPASSAGILKQTALALGADCAVHRDVIRGRRPRSDAILFANRRQLGRIVERLAEQPPGAKHVGEAVSELVALLDRPRPRLEFGRTGTSVRGYDLGVRTLLMGILNITPDSFSDGGQFFKPDAAVRRGVELAEQGADFLDLGAESTRPGARAVPARQELTRLLPVLRALRKRVRMPISIDTTKAETARVGLEEGADMINDISGLRFDPKLAGLVAGFEVPCVVMHIRGRPRTMQRRPRYRDLMGEIHGYLAESVAVAVRAGVRRDRVVVDPGIGFGKSVEDNFTILRRLAELKSLGLPVLIGVSRKSFIGRVLDLPVESRQEGTIAAGVLAVAHGADILRVHDVIEARRAATIADRVLKPQAAGRA